MSGDVILNEQDRGREVPVSAGDVIELRLPENPTTGYRWAFADHAGIEILSDKNDLTQGAAPGAAAARIFVLRVLGGSTELRLRLGQAWDPHASPEAEYCVTLTVR